MQIIKDDIHTWYQEWKRNPMHSHRTMYYDIHTGRMQWINRSDSERPDVFMPVIGLDVVKREYPEWEWALRCTIEYIREKSHKSVSPDGKQERCAL